MRKCGPSRSVGRPVELWRAWLLYLCTSSSVLSTSLHAGTTFLSDFFQTEHSEVYAAPEWLLLLESFQKSIIGALPRRPDREITSFRSGHLPPPQKRPSRHTTRSSHEYCRNTFSCPRAARSGSGHRLNRSTRGVTAKTRYRRCTEITGPAAPCGTPWHRARSR